MYVLVVYDVQVSRINKVHKYLKRYLNWVQNSVFEGELTDAQIETVKIGLEKILDRNSDSVLLYIARQQQWLKKEVVGCERATTDNLL
ncbi:MAG: CRISPR-associated endonuclease Cas2 [Blastocatellia bacterium]|nr:CRISPR-associated endonuclease Cas2 [Blastocatellia bacterium]